MDCARACSTKGAERLLDPKGCLSLTDIGLAQATVPGVRRPPGKHEAKAPSRRRMVKQEEEGIIGRRLSYCFSQAPQRASHGLRACFRCAQRRGNVARPAGYPEKPVRLIVPSSPGGGTDTTMRIIAPKLSEVLGQRVNHRQSPRQSGNIGLEARRARRPMAIP